MRNYMAFIHGTIRNESIMVCCVDCSIHLTPKKLERDQPVIAVDFLVVLNKSTLEQKYISHTWLWA
jgi:hypothetical protein